MSELLEKLKEEAIFEFLSVKYSGSHGSFQFSENLRTIHDIGKAITIKEQKRKELKKAEERLRKSGMTPEEINLQIMIYLSKQRQINTPEDYSRHINDLYY